MALKLLPIPFFWIGLISGDIGFRDRRPRDRCAAGVNNRRGAISRARDDRRGRGYSERAVRHFLDLIQERRNGCTAPGLDPMFAP
jgi:hypothetical protein